MTKYLLVGSSGGHLTHLWWLRSLWAHDEAVWVTQPTPDAQGRLQGERVYWAASRSNRSGRALLANLGLAWRVLGRERPDVVLTSGAAVAVPFVYLAWLRGIPTVYLQVFDRVDRPSLSARLCAPVVTEMVCQWPSQRQALGRGVVLGAIR